MSEGIFKEALLKFERIEPDKEFIKMAFRVLDQNDVILRMNTNIINTLLTPSLKVINTDREDKS